MCTVIMLAHSAGAQKNTERSGVKKGYGLKPSDQSGNSAVITLNSFSAYEARMGNPAMGPQVNFIISDPLIHTLNIRAKGIEPEIKDVEILGMPKGAYGYAHGKLRVFPSSTTSSGTITGMGTVGTGSSPGTMGSTGLRSGANGKSPYAGLGMWGNSRGLRIEKSDIIRQ